MADENEVAALGWDAIDKALSPVYGKQEPLHYGTLIKFAIGGPDPIDGVSVYRSDNGLPHWHYVSYGFTELYAKESENRDVSGFGFELTMRLMRNQDEEPPQWPISLMQNLARYVFSSGNVFEHGHYVDCNGPIALGTDTQLLAVIFVEDPELKSIDTPHGKVTFLQIVGVTLDELKAAKRWNTSGIAKLINQRIPLMITDLKRGSILSDNTAVKEIEEGVLSEGSSTGSLFLNQINYKVGFLGKCQLTLGAIAIADLRSLLPARLGHGHPLILAGGQCAVRLEPAEKFSCKEKDGVLTIALSKTDSEALTNKLSDKAGEYKILDGLTIKVEKTEIRDNEGKVVQVLG